MRTLNDAVKDRLGSLLMSICEAEIFIAEKDMKIAELEKKIAELMGKEDKEK